MNLTTNHYIMWR